MGENDKYQMVWRTNVHVNRHNRRIRKHLTYVEKHLA